MMIFGDFLHHLISGLVQIMPQLINFYVGIGITKSNMLWDGSAKYSIITQTKGKYPVSVTYYGNMAYDTRKDAGQKYF